MPGKASYVQVCERLARVEGGVASALEATKSQNEITRVAFAEVDKKFVDVLKVNCDMEKRMALLEQDRNRLDRTKSIVLGAIIGAIVTAFVAWKTH